MENFGQIADEGCNHWLIPRAKAFGNSPTSNHNCWQSSNLSWQGCQGKLETFTIASQRIHFYSAEIHSTAHILMIHRTVPTTLSSWVADTQIAKTKGKWEHQAKHRPGKLHSTANTALVPLLNPLLHSARTLLQYTACLDFGRQLAFHFTENKS